MTEAVTFRDRYSSAVRANNLHSNPDTTRSASDVLGAAGFASIENPLGIALIRLLSGDNGAANEIVTMMAKSLVGKAWHAYRMNLDPTQAKHLSQAVLAWYRHGSCKPCGGHGYLQVEGTPTLSTIQCKACNGYGRVPFEKHLKGARLELARWLGSEIERELSYAGPAAMRALAPRLEL